MLQRGDELPRLQQAFVRAGIKPGVAPAHDFHVQLALFKIQTIEVGDLQFAAR
ncbi:hypothetical protein SDC9_107996 [bioreactor metagenome]|uniref:Uncharacterized protein n=1 Tax=bioreactor metagenome TaxID=1076179 RepID=A0A645B6W0_9ZZZZ